MITWVDRYINTLRTGRKGDHFAHLETLPERPALYGDLDRPLPETLQRVLESRGISRLYSHQAEAINHIAGGNNVIVSTSTASGKSLCYHLPSLATILAQRSSRVLYMFPTKALAHDQLESLGSLVPPGASIVRNAYDGDTPKQNRRGIRHSSDIIITNPDMLHTAILPYHRGWTQFLRNLRFVVIDEAHYYRGVLGAHVAMIVRRLRRVCREYGANPQFVLCSATLTNASEHAENLVGLPFEAVDQDGSPSGGRSFAFWNPFGFEEDYRKGVSLNMEAADLTAGLVGKGVKTMTFARSRAGVERICDFTRNMLNGSEERVQPYRAGYLADYRRDTERRLQNGDVTGLVTTNAMELGVDVGSLDATVLAGFPGTISSVWQQAGRSGRAQDPALSVLIARDHLVDQFYMSNPEEFFAAPYESARISTTNPRVLEQHLRCASKEIPLSRQDFDLFGEEVMTKAAGALVDNGDLVVNADRTRSLADQESNPAFDISIRSMDSERWQIVGGATGEVLEKVDSRTVFYDLYPGAVYMHKGMYYEVTDVDWQAFVAEVRAIENCNFYTTLEVETEIRIVDKRATRPAGESFVSLGIVEVSATATQYMKKRIYSDEVMDVIALDLPPRVFETVGLWFGPPPGRPAGPPGPLSGALAALEYVGVNALSMYAMCDPSDLIGASDFMHQDTGNPEVFLLDNHPGGVGISELGYSVVEQVWGRMRDIIATCPCTEGCPRCVDSPSRHNKDADSDKAGALRLLNTLLGRRALNGNGGRRKLPARARH